MQWSFFCPNSYQKVWFACQFTYIPGAVWKLLGCKEVASGKCWRSLSLTQRMLSGDQGSNTSSRGHLQWSRCKAREQNSELRSSIGLPWAAPDVKRTSTTENGLGLSNNVCYFSFRTTQPLARLYLDVSLILWLRMESWRLPRFPWFWYKTA